MFDSSALYKKPLIQTRQEFIGSLPDYFSPMTSEQFWFYLDNDLIEKIVAMRVYPQQNSIAFKLLPRGSHNYVSIMLSTPELRILKRIWDCGRGDFNTAIKYYLNQSSNCFSQWVHQPEHSAYCTKWYSELSLGLGDQEDDSNE